MAGPYIPTRDTDFNSWLANFSTLLTASPGTYGLLAADATTVAGVTSTWTAAYTLAIDPTTRTPVTVTAKDDAKINALAIVRPYSQLISANSGVLTADKVAIGVNARTNTPTPIGAPVTYPAITLQAGTFLQHIFRYHDSAAPATSRSKPPGVIQLQVYAAPSETVITDPAVLPLKAVATKVPVVIDWDSSNQGKTAYYAWRWITRTGLVGPWSPINTAIVM